MCTPLNKSTLRLALHDTTNIDCPLMEIDKTIMPGIFFSSTSDCMLIDLSKDNPKVLDQSHHSSVNVHQGINLGKVFVEPRSKTLSFLVKSFILKDYNISMPILDDYKNYIKFWKVLTPSEQKYFLTPSTNLGYEKNRNYLVTEKFTGNLFKSLPLHLDNKIKICLQLMAAFSIVLSKGFILNDIKSHNILYSIEELRGCFTDFAGLSDFDQIIQDPRNDTLNGFEQQLKISTPSFLPFGEFLTLQRRILEIKNTPYEERRKLLEDVKVHLHQMGIFSLGICLYHFLTKKSPYEDIKCSSFSGCPTLYSTYVTSDISTKNRWLQEALLSYSGCSQKLTHFLVEMLNPDNLKRPQLSDLIQFSQSPLDECLANQNWLTPSQEYDSDDDEGKLV
jgi:serine/threonine protein kinase